MKFINNISNLLSIDLTPSRAVNKYDFDVNFMHLTSCVPTARHYTGINKTFTTRLPLCMKLTEKWDRRHSDPVEVDNAIGFLFAEASKICWQVNSTKNEAITKIQNLMNKFINENDTGISTVLTNPKANIAKICDLINIEDFDIFGSHHIPIDTAMLVPAPTYAGLICLTKDKMYFGAAVTLHNLISIKLN